MGGSNVGLPCCVVGRCLTNRPICKYRAEIRNSGRKYNSKNTSRVNACLVSTFGHSSMQSVTSSSPSINVEDLVTTSNGKKNITDETQMTAMVMKASRIVSLRLLYRTICQYRSPAIATRVPIEPNNPRPKRNWSILQRAAPNGQCPRRL